MYFTVIINHLVNDLIKLIVLKTVNKNGSTGSLDTILSMQAIFIK